MLKGGLYCSEVNIYIYDGEQILKLDSNMPTRHESLKASVASTTHVRMQL